MAKKRVGEYIEYETQPDPLEALVKEVATFYHNKSLDEAKNKRYVQSGIISQMADMRDIASSGQIKDRITMLQGMAEGGNLDPSLVDMVGATVNTLNSVYMPMYEKRESIVDNAQNTLNALDSVELEMAKGKLTAPEMKNAKEMINTTVGNQLRDLEFLDSSQRQEYKDTMKKIADGAVLFDVLLDADDPATTNVFEMNVPDAYANNAVAMSEWNNMKDNVMLGEYGTGVRNLIAMQRANAAQASANIVKASKKRRLRDRSIIGVNLEVIADAGKQKIGDTLAPDFGSHSNFKENYGSQLLGIADKAIKDMTNEDYDYEAVLKSGDLMQQLSRFYGLALQDSFINNPNYAEGDVAFIGSTKEREAGAINTPEETVFRKLMHFKFEESSKKNSQQADETNDAAKSLIKATKNAYRGISENYFERTEAGRKFLSKFTSEENVRKGNLPSFKDVEDAMWAEFGVDKDGKFSESTVFDFKENTLTGFSEEQVSRIRERVLGKVSRVNPII